MKRFFADIKKNAKYIVFAAQTELKAEVANSYLNWLWWIIEPICFMFIYSFVFGKLFGSSEPYFIVFVFIGITMWSFFSRTLTESVKLVRANKAIVSKVYIPKYILIFVKMYVNAFKMAVSFVVLIVLMLIIRVPFTWNILWSVPILLVMMTFTFAFSTILMHLGVYVDDLGNIVKIVLRMAFYLTGVFYNLHSKVGKAIGEQMADVISHVNPMASVLSDMRNALLYGCAPDFKYLSIWFGIGIALSALGIFIIYKNENNYVKVI